MNYKLFLDTNVVFNLIFERPPFNEDVAKLLQLQDIFPVDFYISALTLANAAYHLKKTGKNVSFVIDKLLQWFHVIELEKTDFEKTISSKFKDFEDGLQHFSAYKIKKIDAIITRNKKTLSPHFSHLYSTRIFNFLF